MKYKKYRKKPVVIEAIQFKGFENLGNINNFMGGNIKIKFPEDTAGDIEIVIETLEGRMIASVGDYIIKGVNGEFYPCKEDIFLKTYEDVE